MDCSDFGPKLKKENKTNTVIRQQKAECHRCTHSLTILTRTHLLTKFDNPVSREITLNGSSVGFGKRGTVVMGAAAVVVTDTSWATALKVSFMPTEEEEARLSTTLNRFEIKSDDETDEIAACCGEEQFEAMETGTVRVSTSVGGQGDSDGAVAAVAASKGSTWTAVTMVEGISLMVVSE